MPPRKQLYEGKAKILYEGPKPGTIIQHFKDDATAFNAQKKGTVSGKGELNNRITEYIMTRLESAGIPTHFIERIDAREQLCRKVDIIPLEVIVRNIAAGSICTRLGIEEGTPLPRPMIELTLKDDDLGDPLVAEEHALVFGWADRRELDYLFETSFKVNDILKGLFADVGIQLVDFKLEYGRAKEDGKDVILLADEFSPDNCRLWDMETGRKLDKDRFRQDLGGVSEAYVEVATRLGILEQ